MGKKAVSKLFYHLSILSTFLLAGITLAGAFSGQLSPAGHIRFAFIGLALPVLLLINFAALIYWAMRLRVWLLIPLIAILGNWGYLSRVIRFSSPPPSLAAFTIATYNVDAFNGDQTGYSCKEIARYMEEQHADILCMQEFGSNREFNVDSVKKAFSTWPYYSIPQAPAGTPILQ
ncbi:endonuclease, partial [Bacteroides salyersiae]